MVMIGNDALTLLLTLIAPVAVALITKAHASSRLKAAVLLVLTALVTWLSKERGDDGSAVITAHMAFEWAITTAVALASYLGFWKPVAQVNDRALPNLGISDQPDPNVDLENQIG